MAEVRFIAHDTDQYTKEYEQGWRASQRARSYTLDRADRRGVSHAWYDGYHDAAAGREKWHLRDCEAHFNTEGGCGQA